MWVTCHYLLAYSKCTCFLLLNVVCCPWVEVRVLRHLRHRLGPFTSLWTYAQADTANGWLHTEFVAWNFTAVRVVSFLCSLTSSLWSRTQQRVVHPLAVFNCYWALGTQRAVLGLNMHAWHVNGSMPPSGTPQVICNQTSSLPKVFFFFF